MQETPRPFTTFIVDPQGVARPVPIPVPEDPAKAEARNLFKQWEDEGMAKLTKDVVGRLVAIGGLLLVVTTVYFDKRFEPYDVPLLIIGGVIHVIGRIMIMRAAYAQHQRTQDALEMGMTVFDKLGHWF